MIKLKNETEIYGTSLKRKNGIKNIFFRGAVPFRRLGISSKLQNKSKK
jgi:hypothetical protein